MLCGPSPESHLRMTLPLSAHQRLCHSLFWMAGLGSFQCSHWWVSPGSWQRVLCGWNKPRSGKCLWHGSTALPQSLLLPCTPPWVSYQVLQSPVHTDLEVASPSFSLSNCHAHFWFSQSGQWKNPREGSPSLARRVWRRANGS